MYASFTTTFLPFQLQFHTTDGVCSHTHTLNSIHSNLLKIQQERARAKTRASGYADEAARRDGGGEEDEACSCVTYDEHAEDDDEEEENGRRKTAREESCSGCDNR